MDAQLLAQLTKLDGEVRERQATAAKLVEADVTARTSSLDAFEKLSPADRSELYHAAPAVYRQLMSALQEKNERALFERP